MAPAKDNWEDPMTFFASFVSRTSLALAAVTCLAVVAAHKGDPSAFTAQTIVVVEPPVA